LGAIPAAFLDRALTDGQEEVVVMKVILNEDVPNVGKLGATVNVADGFARNFLLPRKLAVRADSATAQQIEHQMRVLRKREEKQRVAFAALAKSLEGVTVEIKARGGEEEKLFGSVTNAQIAEKLAEMGYTIDRKSILLDEPIKALGIYGVPVRLASGIEATIKVWITPIEEEAIA
jgi:large subunit ribosomal protein L9